MTELAEGTVDVWEVSLDIDDAATAELATVLSNDESERANRFVEERARQQYVISRAAIREILGTYLARAPREITFTMIGAGKPVLAAPNELQLEFNMSHSGELAVIGVARSRQIGIDVEQVRPLPRALQLAKRFFSASEYAILRELPGDELARSFLSIWVRREGTAKAQGLSVWRGLAKLETSAAWTPVSLDLGAEYVGVVVAAGDDWRVVRRGLFHF